MDKDKNNQNNLNFNEKLDHIDVYEEVRESFLNYAMSVIVSRALPDARDGLKPVHRRILYGANELKIFANSAYKKSARLVGEVMGKYHPHGDAAIYGSIVRMAQDFNMRYPLLDGHGNFGSIDGDSAAAMRYTEVRMTKLTQEMLANIDKDVIDFQDNYDGSEQEPVVLPSLFPNLLINGSNGIAVAMATSIPPHNLSDVIDALIALINNPIIDIEELINIIKAPDFPTGGIVSPIAKIHESYRTGSGSVIIQGKTKDEDGKIIIFELPFQVNKARLIQKIVELVKSKIIDGISDLRDESNKDGIRIVIELKKTADPDFVLNNIYKMTQLQTSFMIHYLALVNGIPKTLNLKEILEVYLKHQVEILTRKTKFELIKAEAREHIVAGLCMALEKIDEIIEVIKKSKNNTEASEKLKTEFHLSARQAKAVLEMQLQRLSGLEKLNLEKELENLKNTINDLNETLNNEQKMWKIISKQLHAIKNAYGDERRTEISVMTNSIDNEALIKQEDIVILLSKNDYIKKIPLTEYRSQNKGGTGSNTISFNEDDALDFMIFGNTHDHYLIFTKSGRVYRVKGYEIYTRSKTSKGIPIINLVDNFEKKDKVQAILRIKKDDVAEENSLVFLTKKGLIKKSSIMHYKNVNKKGKIAINLNEGDEIINVILAHAKTQMVISTFFGNGLRIDLGKIRNLGRTSRGVKAINLVDNQNNYLMSGTNIKDGTHILCVTSKGYGKLIEIDGLAVRSRGTMGLSFINKQNDLGKLVSVKAANFDDEVILGSKAGKLIRISISDISIRKARTAKGIKIMELKDRDTVVNVTIIPNIKTSEEKIIEMQKDLITDENSFALISSIAVSEAIITNEQKTSSPENNDEFNNEIVDDSIITPEEEL